MSFQLEICLFLKMYLQTEVAANIRQCMYMFNIPSVSNASAKWWGFTLEPRLAIFKHCEKHARLPKMVKIKNFL